MRGGLLLNWALGSSPLCADFVFALFYEDYLVKKPNGNLAHVMIITGAWDSTQSQLLIRLITSERMEKGSCSQRLWQLLPCICCIWKRGAAQPEWERMSQGGTHTPDDLMEVDLNKAAERRSNHAGSAITGKKKNVHRKKTEQMQMWYRNHMKLCSISRLHIPNHIRLE